VRKDVGGRALVNEFRAADVNVLLHGGDGLAAQGNDPLLAAFTYNIDEPSLQVELLQAQAAQLRQTKAGGISQFEHGLIA